MNDLKQIQDFFSKPLKENVDKKYNDFLISLRDSGVTNMYGAAPYLEKEFGLNRKEAIEILANWMRSFSKPLKENTTDWPKEVPSRYGDIIFRLVKVMPDRAKYELIDAETGKTWEIGGRVYGTVNQLKASAEDTIKPLRGRQSSQFESVNKESDKIDIVTMDVPLFIRILEYSREDAQTDMDLHDLAEKAIAATKQQGILSMDDYNMLIGDSESLNEQSLDDQAKAYFLAKVKRGEIDTLPEDPKAAFLAQMMKDQMGHDKETLRRERGLEERISKALNGLNEELCAKGKRYIKARKRAGEKSSAYLSGRAVKVCKGQMSGRKKTEESIITESVENEMFAAMKNLATSLEKANDNVKPSPKDEKVEEGIIALGATIIGAPGLMTALGKGANYLGKVFGKDKNAIGEFLKKKGHQLEEFYIESLGGWIKAAFPNKYEGQEVTDETSDLYKAAQKAYAAMLTVAAVGAGYEAGAAANVVKAGVEGGMAVLKSTEVINIIRKLT